MKSLTVFGVGLALAGALACALPTEAQAVELDYRIIGNRQANGHPVVVVPNPTVYPRRYVLQRPAPQRVMVRVHTPPPAVVVRDTRTTVVVDDGPDDDRDPYDTSSIIVAGAGAGGMLFFGDGITGVAPSYKIHLGFAVDAAEFALNFDLIPEGLEAQTSDGRPTPTALYTMGASFNYRFLPDADVHPVAGVGIEAMVLDPHEGESGTAFAVTARVGAELAYPVSDGALALGIDVTGHHPFAATEEFAVDPVDMIGFGAYMNYRF